jgi:hypothetical protein
LIKAIDNVDKTNKVQKDRAAAQGKIVIDFLRFLKVRGDARLGEETVKFLAVVVVVAAVGFGRREEPLSSPPPYAHSSPSPSSPYFGVVVFSLLFRGW